MSVIHTPRKNEVAVLAPLCAETVDDLHDVPVSDASTSLVTPSRPPAEKRLREGDSGGTAVSALQSQSSDDVAGALRALAETMSNDQRANAEYRVRMEQQRASEAYERKQDQAHLLQAIDGIKVQNVALTCRVANIETADERRDDRDGRIERLADVVIRGVPVANTSSPEQVRSIVMRIGQAINCQLEEWDIAHAFVPRSMAGGRAGGGRDPQIIVRFGSLGKRQFFFRRYLAVEGGLNATALGAPVPRRIYVCDNLTSHNAAIRNRAVELKRAGSILSHSARDGIVCVVVGRGDMRRRAVHTIGELNKLVCGEDVGQRHRHDSGGRGSEGSWRVVPGPDSGTNGLTGLTRHLNL